MKRIILLLMAVMAIFLQGCAKWADGSPGNVWMDGLWLAFWLPMIGCLICWYQVWRGHNSPEVYTDVDGKVKPTGREKTPVTRVQYFPWAVGLTVAVIAIYISVTLSR